MSEKDNKAVTTWLFVVCGFLFRLGNMNLNSYSFFTEMGM